MKPLAVALLAALAAALGGAAPHGSAAPKPRPNIVVIETDDQTVRELAAMPNVRNLIGREGATFESSFVTFSLCCPSRATFLTGQYAHNHGVLGNSPPAGGWEVFRQRHATNNLATWLRGSGYYTALVGKFLNGYGKNQTEVPLGWSEWHGGVSLAFVGGSINDGGTVHRLPADESGYQTDVYSALAQGIIRRRAPQAQPFFLWVTPHSPHTGGPRDPDDPKGIGTTRPAARDRDRFASTPLPTPPSFNEADVSDKPAAIRNLPILGAERIAALREAYQQALESMISVDRMVGAIVARLRAAGELSNTLIVFTTDNGFFYGEHRVPAGKVLLYEPSIRVPLLMRGPGIPKGVHLAQLVGNIDLAPTFVDAANATAGLPMDGRSLLPLLGNPRLRWRSSLLIENGPDAGRKGKGRGGRSFVAIRTTRYLYAEYATGEKELYDLVRDPDELQSLHADPAYAPIQADLAQRLARLRSCAGAACRAS